LTGVVAALKSLHAIPTQQGLDLVAIYVRDELPSLAIGESKATERDPGGQLTEAAGFFRDIEAHERDGELVADIAMLEPLLSATMRDQIGESFWLQRRTYLPVIVYGVDFDAGNERPLLSGLAVDRADKRVVTFQIPAFHSFFDDVADYMRAAASLLLL
jgi:hypothetical protein